MSKIVILTGIPGSGKTSILTESVAVLNREGKKTVSVNFGDVMFETSGVAHRDEMRKLPQEKQVENQKKAAEKIAQMARRENVIVDTHCTIKTPLGYLCGLPEWVLKNIKPNVIVLVEADPSEIKSRRDSDESRKRDEESSEDIDAHQILNRAAAISYCMLTGATMKIIKNRNDYLLDAVKDLIRLF
ncbi:MAG: adenylate kinase [Nanoarchaeota archaeon]|nr:adenylate kinase [Nanoarchaeota archaeon]MBU4300413.1 adenylate kinase [Nanoarchaeota archaeon]MBU4451365.1 adenylate kinase [Nanoarchaeota archaeon]MCG2723768.1 adenylate kinase [archaeon]